MCRLDSRPEVRRDLCPCSPSGITGRHLTASPEKLDLLTLNQPQILHCLLNECLDRCNWQISQQGVVRNVFDHCLVNDLPFLLGD